MERRRFLNELTISVASSLTGICRPEVILSISNDYITISDVVKIGLTWYNHKWKERTALSRPLLVPEEGIPSIGDQIVL